MSEFDLSEISSELIRSTLCEIIEEKLNSKKYEVLVKSAAQAGEANFIGIVYRILFSNGNGPWSKLILKVAPKNEARRKQFISRSLFLREIFIYDKVSRSFNSSKLTFKIK